MVLVWRCRARLPNVFCFFLEVFDDCSCAGRRLSPGDEAITRKLNETVLAVNFLEIGGIGFSESCEKVRYSILSNDFSSLSPLCDFGLQTTKWY